MTNQMSYTDACKAAATDQGLDPIVAALQAADVPCSVEQTGGFCMVVSVYPTDEYDEKTPYVYITSGEQWNSGDGWLVVYYNGTDNDGEPDYEGFVLGENEQTVGVVTLMQRFTATKQCHRCGEQITRTLDTNSGTLRWRCEPCDLEECLDCGAWVGYSDADAWHHVVPGTAACFLYRAVPENGERAMKCKICGETITATDKKLGNMAEMYDEATADEGIVHTECGMARGWTIS